MEERNWLHFRQSRNTPTSTITAKTAVTTGQTRAVIDRAPDMPSSAKLTTGLAPPPVVTVETGRAAVRPTCVARAAATPSGTVRPGLTSNAVAEAKANTPPTTGATTVPITCST